MATWLYFLKTWKNMGSESWKNNFTKKIHWLNPGTVTYLYDLSKRDDGAVGCSVWGGWGPEWWEPLGGFPSDCEHVITVCIPRKRYDGGSHDHQSVTHWARPIRRRTNTRHSGLIHMLSSVKVIHHTNTLMQALTCSNSPHYFPGESGIAGRVVRAQTRLHKHQHDQQCETQQTQDHVSDPGLWDLGEGVVNLQVELVGNALQPENILTKTTATYF